MGFFQAIGHVLNNYASFKGRARRSEYWFWTLFMVLAILALQLMLAASMGVAQEPGALAGILSIIIIAFAIGTFIPGLAVTIRRLHDAGKSGWWLLLNLVPFGFVVVLVFLLTDSQSGRNAYGPSPKRDMSATVVRA